MLSSVGSSRSAHKLPIAYAGLPQKDHPLSTREHPWGAQGAGYSLGVPIEPNARVWSHDFGKEAIELFEAFCNLRNLTVQL
jgi:hypothetical protein